MTATANIRIRPLRRDEVGPIDAVFDGMSARSRLLRFHGPRPRLTEQMRRELSAVDGSRHVALVAETLEGGRATPVGIGRFVAVSDEVVEVAFAVVDSWHRRGVGRRLLRALRHRATDLGYRIVVAHVLAENRAAVGLLFTVFPEATMRREGMAYHLVAALPEPVSTGALPLAV